jgi:hypothetical protein
MGSLSQPCPPDSGWPMATGRYSVRSPCWGMASAHGVVRSPTAHQWTNGDEVDGKSSYKDQATHCYTETSKRMIATVFSLERSLARWNSVVEEKDTTLNGSGMGSFYCTGKRKTWGNDLDTRSAMSSMMGRSSSSMAGGARVIRWGRWRRRPMMAQPGAKQPHDQGD